MSTEDTATMTAIVEFEVRAETTSVEAWLGEWSKRAADAFSGEPETLGYEAAVNVEHPRQVLVLERYLHGTASLALHMARPAHAELTDTMGARRMTRRRVMGARFTDIPGYGFWSRPSQAPNAAGHTPSDAMLVLLGMRFADVVQRDAFIELSAEHADYCWANEPDTWVASCGIVASDSDRADIRTGDLVFVMACRDMAAVERHTEDPRHLALGERLTERGIAFETPFSQTYRTTGCGFIHR